MPSPDLTCGKKLFSAIISGSSQKKSMENRKETDPARKSMAITVRIIEVLILLSPQVSEAVDTWHFSNLFLIPEQSYRH